MELGLYHRKQKNKNRYSKKIMDKKQLNYEIKRLKTVWRIKTNKQLIAKLLSTINNLNQTIDELQATNKQVKKTIRSMEYCLKYDCPMLAKQLLVQIKNMLD